MMHDFTDNYTTKESGIKRKNLSELIQTPSDKMTKDERDLLHSIIHGMPDEQLAERFMPDEIEQIKRTRELFPLLQQAMPKILEGLPKFANKLAPLIAEAMNGMLQAVDVFGPIIADAANDFCSLTGRQLTIVEIESVFMRSCTAWAEHAQRGEPLTAEAARPVVLEVFQEYVKTLKKNAPVDESEQLERKTIRPEDVKAMLFSTSKFSRAAVKPETWDGKKHSLTVKKDNAGRPAKVQTMILSQIGSDENTRIKFSRNISRRDLLMLHAVSNASASLILAGAKWFTAADVACFVKGGGGRDLKTDFVDRITDIIEMGRRIMCTIYDEIEVDPTGRPLNPSQRISRWMNDTIFSFENRGGYSNRHVVDGYVPHALPLFARAAMRKNQTVVIQPHWINIPDASLTEERLFMINYVLENIMLMNSRQKIEVKHLANRDRRKRGLALSQNERQYIEILNQKEIRKNEKLRTLTFDKMFETLGISEQWRRRRLLDFLAGQVLPYWKNDLAMPLLDYELEKRGKTFSKIHIDLNPPF